MATMADTYLTIGGLVLMDGNSGSTNYAPATGGWSPKVARVRTSVLGGRGEYEDVDESITIHIRNTSASGCYANLDSITRAMDQANRWAKNENVAPVYVQLAIKGSTVSSSSTPLKAMIIGGNVSVSPAIEFTGNVPYIRNVTLNFTRKGQWLLDDQTVTSSDTANGDQVTMALGTATNILSPTDISLSDIVSQSAKAFVIVSDDNNIDAMDAATMTATGYTAVDEAAKFARNTNVLRYTAPDTAENASGSKTVTAATGVQLTSGLFAVYANIRNNSNSVSYNMRVQLTGSNAVTYTPRLYIPPYSSAAYPEWQFVGLASARILTTIKIYLQASATGGTLDIDTIVMVNVTESRKNIIVTRLLESGGTAGYNSGAAALNVLHAQDAVGGQTFPAVTSVVAADSITYHVFEGDPVFYTSSSSIFGMLLATGSSGDLDTWRQVDTGAVLENAWVATRAVGYLTPR